MIKQSLGDRPDATRKFSYLLNTDEQVALMQRVQRKAHVSWHYVSCLNLGSSRKICRYAMDDFFRWLGLRPRSELSFNGVSLPVEGKSHRGGELARNL